MCSHWVTNRTVVSGPLCHAVQLGLQNWTIVHINNDIFRSTEKCFGIWRFSPFATEIQLFIPHWNFPGENFFEVIGKICVWIENEATSEEQVGKNIPVVTGRKKLLGLSVTRVENFVSWTDIYFTASPEGQISVTLCVPSVWRVKICESLAQAVSRRTTPFRLSVTAYSQHPPYLQSVSSTRDHRTPFAVVTGKQLTG